MTSPQTFTVQPEEAGQRLDVWLLARLGEDHSRAEVQRWIKGGALMMGTQPSTNPAKKVRAGEGFTLTPPARAPSTLVAENIPLEIVYEDEAVLVINKPAGLTVHPAPGNYTGTLVHALLHHCGSDLSLENGADRPGIVHRLDKDTSGLLVVAKTAQAHRHLGRQFMNKGKGGLQRTYLALARGVPNPAEGTIEGNIGRHPTLRIPRAVVKEGGKPAVTHYKVRQVLAAGAASLLELNLETGRTHQIRVHLAHIGHPVLADPLYPVRGPRGPLPGAAGQLVLPNRQLLHAAKLAFRHPLTQKLMAFEASLPADMAELVQLLET